jgi:outer membrane receptor protein involved in Fe transport
MATSNLEVRDQARRLDIVAVNATGATVGRVTENGILRYGSLFDNAAIDARVYAFYASDEWQVTPELRVDAGVRQEHIAFTGSVEGKQTVDLGIAGTLADNQVITGTGAFTPIDRSYSGLSWTLGANYQIQSGLGVFARYTDTVRLPAPSEFQGSPGDALRTDIKKTPVKMIEAGLKWQTDVFDLYATAFQTRFENIRFNDNVFNSATNSFTTRVAYGSTNTVGVEVEGVLKPMEGWDVSGAVSWQNPEYDSFRFTEIVGGVATVRAFAGNQLIRVPKVGVRLVPAVNLLEGAVRLELPVEYYSKRFADVANSQSLAEYTVINLNARWNVSDRMAVSIAGVNLTNVIGLTEGNPRAGQFVSGDAGARYYLARPILGTSWRAALTYRF